MSGDVKNGPIDGSTNIAVKKRRKLDGGSVEGSTSIMPAERRFLLFGRMKIVIIDEKRGSEDRISDLPTDLIDHILNSLPLHEVVKTSILSKAWRNIWTMHPKLIFDWEFYYNFVPRRESGREARRESWREARQSEYNRREAMKSEYNRTINTILSVNKGPILHFHLAIPLGFHCPLHLWIQQLSKKGVQIINLDNFGNDAVSVSLSLFVDCSELNHLTLSNWILSPPNKSGSFANLIQVSLSNILITAGTSFGTQLKVLSMTCCRGIEHLGSQFTRDNNLQSLVISYCTEIEWQWLKCTTKLESLSLALIPAASNTTEFINLDKLLTNIPNCHTLSLNATILQFLAPARSILTRLTTKVVSLKVLIVPLHLSNYFQISLALCLIRSCPNLQDLRITREHNVNILKHMELTAEHYLGSLDRKDLFLDRLQTVRIYEVVNSRSVLHLIKLLLATLPSLKRMLLFCSTKPREKLRIIKELKQFPRLSLEAQLRLCLVDLNGMEKEWNEIPWKHPMPSRVSWACTKSIHRNVLT